MNVLIGHKMEGTTPSVLLTLLMCIITCHVCI